jgi:hypothetical protein
MKRSKNKLIGLLFVAILSFTLLSPFVVAAPEPEEKVGVLLIGLVSRRDTMPIRTSDGKIFWATTWNPE